MSLARDMRSAIAPQLSQADFIALLSTEAVKSGISRSKSGGRCTDCWRIPIIDSNPFSRMTKK